ncbi:MAG: DUF2203 domain-containing protein [Candidatus Woesearchaeota archaeon]|nr:DUF2203 domain-containing protein [Candidatus Woesearchaeota archaeon]
MEIEGENKKFLTVEEANRVLATLEVQMLKLQELNKAIALLRSVSFEYDDDHQNLVSAVKLNHQFHTISAEFYTILHRLLDAGCVVKDIDTGLVDFYSTIDNRIICLCWQLGEKHIQFWHETDAGAQGRKPIAMLRQQSVE